MIQNIDNLKSIINADLFLTMLFSLSISLPFFIFSLLVSEQLYTHLIAELLELKTGYFSLRQIKTATSNFDPANKIGEGGFGLVFKVNLNILHLSLKI